MTPAQRASAYIKKSGNAAKVISQGISLTQRDVAALFADHVDLAMDFTKLAADASSQQRAINAQRGKLLSSDLSGDLGKDFSTLWGAAGRLAKAFGGLKQWATVDHATEKNVSKFAAAEYDYYYAALDWNSAAQHIWGTAGTSNPPLVPYDLQR